MGVTLPPHKYIPGQTKRHPEGHFAAITGTVHDGMMAAELAQSMAFQAGRFYYEQGYYWECHEVLEAVWMAARDGSDARIMVQALIQLANARLKLDMDRPNAVRRLCVIVSDLVMTLDRGDALSVNVEWVRQELSQINTAI